MPCFPISAAVAEYPFLSIPAASNHLLTVPLIRSEYQSIVRCMHVQIVLEESLQLRPHLNMRIHLPEMQGCALTTCGLLLFAKLSSQATMAPMLSCIPLVQAMSKTGKQTRLGYSARALAQPYCECSLMMFSSMLRFLCGMHAANLGLPRSQGNRSRWTRALRIYQCPVLCCAWALTGPCPCLTGPSTGWAGDLPKQMMSAGHPTFKVAFM